MGFLRMGKLGLGLIRLGLIWMGKFRLGFVRMGKFRLGLLGLWQFQLWRIDQFFDWQLNFYFINRWFHLKRRFNR
ncbi:MAG: hypothetical protein Pars2KO_23390 [Parasphingorhabdus sp.]